MCFPLDARPLSFRISKDSEDLKNFNSFTFTNSAVNYSKTFPTNNLEIKNFRIQVLDMDFQEKFNKHNFKDERIRNLINHERKKRYIENVMRIIQILCYSSKGLKRSDTKSNKIGAAKNKVSRMVDLKVI